MVKKVTKNKCELAVAVSRFGHEPLPVCVPEGASVRDVLEKAEISLSGREKVYVAGAEASMRDVVEEGDVLSIVTPKQAGNK